MPHDALDVAFVQHVVDGRRAAPPDRFDVEVVAVTVIRDALNRGTVLQLGGIVLVDRRNAVEMHSLF
ncbi:MAG: hypothetical protein ACREMJ_08215, partial [Gemmatimonadales bacterium]